MSDFTMHRKGSSVNALLGFLVIFIGVPIGILVGAAARSPILSGVLGTLIFLLGILVILTLRVANQWEKAVVLTLGKFSGTKGPGVFFLVPIVQEVVYWIDIRVMTTSFSAEQTLTKDGVPVNVDAVLFWKVTDTTRAAFEVENYAQAVGLASQTALREVIGKTELAIFLSKRDELDEILKGVIENRAQSWGILVQSVEIRDVTIPEKLQDAISMQAQAERERSARVILGDSERLIATSFEKAAEVYASNPTALHLRAMNMLYEALKERGALVIVPSSAVETMGLGTLTGLTALSREVPRTSSHPAAPPDAKG